MASRSTIRIFTACGVCLQIAKMLYNTDFPKEQIEPFQVATLKAFGQQKNNELTLKEAKAIRKSVGSRFSGNDLPFSYIEKELTEIRELVQSSKKEKIQDVIDALLELRGIIPTGFNVV